MKYIFPLLFLFLVLVCNAQEKQSIVLEKIATIRLAEIKEDWKVNYFKKDQPYPGGESYRDFLTKRKAEIEAKYATKYIDNTSKVNLSEVDTPIVTKGYIGNSFNGGVPNDNSIAISNDGILMSGTNSLIWVWDTNADTIMWKRTLGAFAEDLNLTGHKYDPKFKYDPVEDRFIVVFLNGFTPEDSKIIVGFSATNDPLGDWHLYYLEGNPLDNGFWSDYPALGLTQDDFYVTINLIEPGVSWQEGFRGSLIWQMDKSTGFNGENLVLNLWSDIKYNDAFIRNLHPISGGSDLYGPEMYFLSNRNFDETNDTIFVLEINGNTQDATTLNVRFGKSSQPYGMPIDGRQQGSHRLATNDARVLGGFLENNQIQFVSNTIDHATGNAAVYHGFITDYSNNPNITGVILGDSTDWGYPNIAYTGRYEGDNEAIINFNFVHPDIYSSCGVLFYDGEGYSTKKVVMSGESYVNMLSGNVERWGDYSGMQRVYDEPGKVWCTGTYGRQINYNMQTRLSNQTYVYSVSSPDSTTYEDIYPPVFELNTYPNPTTDLMIIELDLPETTFITIEVFDLNGKLLKVLLSEELSNGVYDFQFSTSPLSSGVYFLKVKTNENLNLVTEKFTKF